MKIVASGAAMAPAIGVLRRDARLGTVPRCRPEVGADDDLAQ
ncbi:MAG TPA: hypothetical protein VET87_20455 [Rubrivivax sp.]|jgi:hypothetical protein|nr:hypothetical protein [Rubrivivax sp.]